MNFKDLMNLKGFDSDTNQCKNFNKLEQCCLLHLILPVTSALPWLLRWNLMNIIIFVFFRCP